MCFSTLTLALSHAARERVIPKLVTVGKFSFPSGLFDRGFGVREIDQFFDRFHFLVFQIAETQIKLKEGARVFTKTFADTPVCLLMISVCTGAFQALGSLKSRTACR